MSSVLQTPEVSQLLGQNNVHRNLFPPQLVEAALRRGEAELAARGSLVAETGKRTGRSPKDKFTVKDSVTESKIAWGSANQPFPAEKFDALYDRVLDYLRSKELFVQDLFCGADPQYRLPIQIINEYAWHNLFVRAFVHSPHRRRTEDPQTGIHHRQRSRLQGRSQARRHQLRSIRDRELHQETGAHRRHPICRRNEEVHLRHHELPAARSQCFPYALLGEHRQRWRYRAVLRIVGHRQDDALSRPQPPADRRRRAWMERDRRVQL